MKVYTKTGDRGETSLVGGERVSKCCARLESYGTIDELNSHIGMLIAECDADHDRMFLVEVQSALFVVGGYLATDNSHTAVRPGNTVTPGMVEAIEREIDAINSALPPLRLFILPGGTRAASQAHICRTVCRRAERRILALREEGAKVDDLVVSYVNRLSDYFFVLARKLNNDANHPESTWQSRKQCNE